MQFNRKKKFYFKDKSLIINSNRSEYTIFSKIAFLYATSLPKNGSIGKLATLATPQSAS